MEKGNVINALKLYKIGPLYAFDKEEWNTKGEIFVSSATSYLEKLTDKDEPTLIFSDKPFKDSHRVDLLKEDAFGGSDWYSEEFDHYLWLCSYTRLYYPILPKELYLQVI